MSADTARTAPAIEAAREAAHRLRSLNFAHGEDRGTFQIYRKDRDALVTAILSAEPSYFTAAGRTDVVALLRRMTLDCTCEFRDCDIHNEARAFLSVIDGKEYQ